MLRMGASRLKGIIPGDIDWSTPRLVYTTDRFQI
jgi:hypothetical protein